MVNALICEFLHWKFCGGSVNILCYAVFTDCSIRMYMMLL